MLTEVAVDSVVDVRLTPISRKPGFSKSALADAVRSRGIAYEHRRVLGNPKENRAGFAGGPRQLAGARAVYLRRLCVGEARDVVRELVERSARERIALLCFERDTERCHRYVLLEEIGKLGGKILPAFSERVDVVPPTDGDALRVRHRAR